jgi:phosphatidylglycerophosphate synthase
LVCAGHAVAAKKRDKYHTKAVERKSRYVYAGGLKGLVTIDEIRRVGQPPEKLKMAHPYGKHVLRKVTPYFTKFFIEHNVTANQVSSLSVLFGIVGDLLFVFGNYPLMILGCVIFQFYHLFDCVDGEIARVTSNVSLGGRYLEGIHDAIIESVFMACFGIGMFKMYGSIIFLYTGFIFALSICLLHDFNRTRKWVVERLEKKKEYAFPLMRKQSTLGRVYRSLYRKVRLLFLFHNTYLLLPFILIFEIVFPIKLSYTLYGAILSLLSSYFLLYGLDWIIRTFFSSITNYRYLMHLQKR